MRGKAARGQNTRYVNFLEFAQYMRTEISARSNHTVFPEPGALAPGGWPGSFVFAIGHSSKDDISKLVESAHAADKTWKALGEREFFGQVSYLISREAFDSPQIIDVGGWFDAETLVKIGPHGMTSSLRAMVRHQTFHGGSPERPEATKGGARSRG
jgi:hypothetical protein